MSAVCTNLNLPIKCLPHFLQSEKSSDETPVGKAEIVVSGNNDVVNNPDGNGLTGSADLCRGIQIGSGRLEAAARVVVGQDHGGCLMAQGCLHYMPGIDRR